MFLILLCACSALDTHYTHCLLLRLEQHSALYDCYRTCRWWTWLLRMTVSSYPCACCSSLSFLDASPHHSQASFILAGMCHDSELQFPNDFLLPLFFFFLMALDYSKGFGGKYGVQKDRMDKVNPALIIRFHDKCTWAMSWWLKCVCVCLQSAGTFEDVEKPITTYQRTKPVEAGMSFVFVFSFLIPTPTVCIILRFF